jgi:hypothetical protein
MPTMSTEYNKNYYEKNKDRQKAYVKEKIMCEQCKVEISRSNMGNHCKTKKHVNNMMSAYNWLDRMKDKASFANSIDLLLADMQKLKDAYDEVKK